MKHLIKLATVSFTLAAIQFLAPSSVFVDQALAGSQDDASEGHGAAEQEADSKSGWLDDYLAAALDYNQQQVDAFKSSVADLPDAELRALVESMKLQRQMLNDASHDINSADRKQRLAAAKRDLDRLERAKALAVRSKVPSRYSTGSAFGHRPRRSYRGLYYIRNFHGYRHHY